MAILIDPTSDDKLQARQAASTASTLLPSPPLDVQHQHAHQHPVADESSPLLPPAYTDGRRASDVEETAPQAGSSRKCKPINRRWGLIMLALVAGALATAGTVLFSQTAREDWTHPDWHEHDHPSYPGTPLHVRNATFHLPLAASEPAFFLHAFGEDAVGSVTIVSKPLAKESVVDVEVSVIYADEDKLKERVRVWEVVDGKDRHGVDIMTPRMHGINYRSRTDYIRFQVVLRVPADAKALDFEGMTTTMSLRVEGDQQEPSYRSFDYTTRSSHIDFSTLEAETVKLTTTNARISMLGDTANLSQRVGLRAKQATFKTTNGQVNLSTAHVEVSDLLTIKSTSGAVLGWAGETQPVKHKLLSKLTIETTNAGIKGQWAANEVKARTTNGVISASFGSVTRSASLQTTNDRLTALVELGLKALDVVPISAQTTNGVLELTVASAQGQAAASALKIEASTTNERMRIVAPDFAGAFTLGTSNAGIDVVGERVHIGARAGSQVKGDRLTTSGGKGKGSLTARTANARIDVQF